VVGACPLLSARIASTRKTCAALANLRLTRVQVFTTHGYGDHVFKPEQQAAHLATGTSTVGAGPDHGASGTPLAPPEISPGSAATKATWRGGPLDGVTMSVIAGEQFFPLYGAVEVEGDTTPESLPADRGRAPRRLCPVLPGPDGRLIIDWHAGAHHP
jgi:hypothetical protein